MNTSDFKEKKDLTWYERRNLKSKVAYSVFQQRATNSADNSRATIENITDLGDTVAWDDWRALQRPIEKETADSLKMNK